MQAQQRVIRNRSFASRFLHLETKAYEMSAMCEAEIALISYHDDGLRKIRGHPRSGNCWIAFILTGFSDLYIEIRFWFWLWVILVS